MRIEKLRKVGLCVTSSCFIKSFKMMLFHKTHFNRYSQYSRYRSQDVYVFRKLVRWAIFTF